MQTLQEKMINAVKGISTSPLKIATEAKNNIKIQNKIKELRNKKKIEDLRKEYNTKEQIQYLRNKIASNKK